MTWYDWLMLGVGLLGLVAQEWVPKVHPVWRSAIIAVGFAALAYSSTLWLQDMTAMKIQTGPLVVILVGIAIVAAGVLWHINVARTQIAGPAVPPQSPSPPPQPPKNSPTINAGGNVTIGHIGDVTINQAPAPEIRIGETKSTQNSDGTFTETVILNIAAPYPVGQIYIEAWAPEIIDFEVGPNRTGMAMYGPSGKRPEFAFTTLMQAFGEYTAVVHLKKQSHIELRYKFN